MQAVESSPVGQAVPGSNTYIPTFFKRKREIWKWLLGRQKPNHRENRAAREAHLRLGQENPNTVTAVLTASTAGTRRENKRQPQQQ